MSSTTSSSNLTSGFIDLATFDELEKYLYGGSDATTYFVRKVRKSTWFTIVPVVLTKQQGGTYGQQFSAIISRAGDYIIRSWLRVQIQSLTLDETVLSSVNPFGSNVATDKISIRYTRNFMHNLIRECSITFNDLVESRFDNFFLDFWSAFTVPAGKRNGYQNMIGNFEELTNPIAIGGQYHSLPSVVLNLPLPFTHFRETGLSLPTAALPYNEMKINVATRQLNELLVLDDTLHGVSAPCPASLIPVSNQQLVADMWAEYAIVSNMERTQMGKAPRDILIEQVQTAPQAIFNTALAAPNSINLHFAHAIKAMFFAAQNTTNSSEWSNYTCASPVPTGKGVIYSPPLATDPIATTSLYYENTQRLSNMGSDYFSLIQPWYTATDIPLETGYHLYSYTLDLTNSNPLGSTNYGKLTNVTLACVPSADATITGNAPGTSASIARPSALAFQGAPVNQSFQLVVVVVNHNIIRIAGGALGFPVL